MFDARDNNGFVYVGIAQRSGKRRRLTLSVPPSGRKKRGEHAEQLPPLELAPSRNGFGSPPSFEPPPHPFPWRARTRRFSESSCDAGMRPGFCR